MNAQKNAVAANLATVQNFILSRLVAVRKSQRWLAKECDMSQAHLNNWLHNRSNCTAGWIAARAAKLAVALSCEESEILDRIPASTNLQSKAEPQDLNRNILKALFEHEHPTDELMGMMQRVEAAVGIPLSYEVCKELIKLATSK